MPRGKFGQRGFIAEIKLFEGELLALRLAYPVDPRTLQRRIVIIVEIVDADNLLAAVEQRLHNMRSYETGSAGDEQSHVRSASEPFAAARGGLHGRYGTLTPAQHQKRGSQ